MGQVYLQGTTVKEIEKTFIVKQLCRKSPDQRDHADALGVACKELVKKK